VRRWLLVPFAFAFALTPACHRRPAWVLLHPPEVRDESYPRGYRLLPAAPLADWHAVEGFADQDACEAARRKNVDQSIDRARAAHGDDAKYELTVRRAVHAVCTRPPSP
jgi:hypothetical protein